MLAIQTFILKKGIKTRFKKATKSDLLADYK